jgi:hypothetical protein
MGVTSADLTKIPDIYLLRAEAHAVEVAERCVRDLAAHPSAAMASLVEQARALANEIGAEVARRCALEVDEIAYLLDLEDE